MDVLPRPLSCKPALLIACLLNFLSLHSTIAQKVSDPWRATQVVEPDSLAKSIPLSHTNDLHILCVGYSLFYQNGHIPGALPVGPASKPEGRKGLTSAVRHLSHRTHIVLYCGCCPMAKCPNIRPAFRTLQELGFTNVSVLDLPRGFQQDWVDLKLPTRTGNGSSGH